MSKLIKGVVSLSAIASWLTLLLPPSPTLAANQFDVCIRQLAGTGVTPEQAGTACADALLPRDLSACVRRIHRETAIKGEDALDACYRVRRPIDLSYCVVDIDRTLLRGTKAESGGAEDSLALALDSCRRSLLPGRYSQCVIGFARSVADATAVEAMNSCLDAQDYPPSLFPAYSN